MSAWVFDASTLDFHRIESILLRSRSVNEFLNEEGKTFISANKGIGKTLLLKYKRFLLEKKYASSHEKEGRGRKVTFVPSGHPYLDSISEIGYLSHEKIDLLAGLQNCKKLWDYSFKVSAILHSRGLVETMTEEDLEFLPRFTRSMVRRGEALSPLIIFNDLVSNKSVGELHRELSSGINLLDRSYRSIHSGIFFFIDQIDQNIMNLPRDAWINIQTGLISAAHNIMLNSHVKVFASIRQEAFASFRDPQIGNIHNRTTVIKYEIQDLRSILDNFAREYEGKKSFYEMFASADIHNNSSKEAEDLFLYVLRHTLGKPRDLVHVFGQLTDLPLEGQDEKVKLIVNEISEEKLMPPVFEEIRPFLESLHEIERRGNFFGRIESNVLTYAEVKRIFLAFNDLSDAQPGEFQEILEKDSFHPFCELYNSGLLGVVGSTPEKRNLQLFKQPYSMTNQFRNILPESKFYFIHPGLQQLVRNARKPQEFDICPYLTVGHLYAFTLYHEAMINAYKAVKTLDPTEVKSDLIEMLRAIHDRKVESVKPVNLRRFPKLLKRWESIRGHIEGEGQYDQTVNWFNHLFEHKL